MVNIPWCTCNEQTATSSVVPVVSSGTVDAVGNTFSLADKETKNANGRTHKQIVK